MMNYIYTYTYIYIYIYIYIYKVKRGERVAVPQEIRDGQLATQAEQG